MKKTITRILAFVAALVCGGAWAATPLVYNQYLTSEYADTGWTVASADDLASRSFAGVMAGANVNSGNPLPSTGYYVTKQDDDTVTFEMQVKNNELKAILVRMQIVNGKVRIKGEMAGYRANNAQNPIGTRCFSANGTSCADGTSPANFGTSQSAENSYACGAVDEVLSWSNASYVGKEGYSVGEGKYGPYRLRIPATADLPLGSILRIKEISIARRDGYTDQKNVISVGSASDANVASDGNSVDTTDQLGGKTRIRYPFSNNVMVQVGTEYPSYLLNQAGGGATGNTMNIHVIKPIDEGADVLKQTNNNLDYCAIYEVKAEVVRPDTSRDEDVSFVTPNAPTKALKATIVADNTAFGANQAYTRLVNGRIVQVVNVTNSTAAATAKIFGGTAQNAEGAVNADIWMNVSGGTYGAIFGGSNCDNWADGVRQSTIRGNVVLEVGGSTTANNVLGGFYKDGRGPTLNGNIDVVIKDQAVVKGVIAGAGMSAHNNNAAYTGNVKVTVKNVQSDNSAEALSNADSSDYIVGGGVYGTNANSKENITGNTAVVIDLPNGAEGSFVKNIVGGGFIPTGGASRGTPECKVSGNTSVSISAPAGVTFSGVIYAGGYLAGASSGNVSVGGTASVTLNGGTYTGSIKAGTATGAKTLAVNGDITVKPNNTAIEGFDSLTIANTKTLTLDAEEAKAMSLSVPGTGSIAKRGAGVLTLNDLPAGANYAVAITDGGLTLDGDANGLTIDMNSESGTLTIGTSRPTVNVCAGRLSLTLTAEEFSAGKLSIPVSSDIASSFRTTSVTILKPNGTDEATWATENPITYNSETGKVEFNLAAIAPITSETEDKSFSAAIGDATTGVLAIIGTDSDETAFTVTVDRELPEGVSVVVSGHVKFVAAEGYTGPFGTMTYTEGATITLPSASDTTIPSGVTMNVGTLSGTITNNGTLNVTGNSTYTLTNNGTLNVKSGISTVSRASDQSIKGTVNIDAGAEFVNKSGDAVSYGDPGTTFNVRGTLTMADNSRWTVGGTSKINLYGGCTVTGAKTGDGAFDLYRNGEIITVNRGADESISAVTIDARIRARNGSADNASEINIANGMTLAVTGGFVYADRVARVKRTGNGHFTGTIPLSDVTLIYSTGSVNNIPAHFVVSGTSTIEWHGSGSDPVCSNDTKADPFITVNPNATLNIYGHDFSGCNGALRDTGWIVNNGTLVFANGSGSRFWREHIVFGDGSTMCIDHGDSALLLYGGAGTVDTCQFMLPFGAATIKAGEGDQAGDKAVLYFGNDGSGGWGDNDTAKKATGFSVGDGATLTVSAPIKGDQAVSKFGAGTLVFSSSDSSYSGMITLNEGVIKSKVAFGENKVVCADVNKKIDITTDGDYTVYTLGNRDPEELYYVANYFNGSTSGDQPTLKKADGTEMTYRPGYTIVIRDTTGGQVGCGDSLWFAPTGFPLIRVERNITFKSGTADTSLDGSSITILENKTVTFVEGDSGRGVNLGSVTMNGPGVVQINGTVTAKAIEGDAKLKLAEGATLTVKTNLGDGKVVSGVDTKKVKKVTNEGEVTTYTYSLFTPVAKIGEVYFDSVAAAIDAAGDGLSLIEVLVQDPVMPEGYCFVDGRVVKAQASVTTQSDKTYHATIEAAINAAANGGQVNFEADIALGTTLVLEKSIYLNLNAHTLSCTDVTLPAIRIPEDVILQMDTVNGGAISSEGVAVEVNVRGKMIVWAGSVRGKVVMNWAADPSEKDQPLVWDATRQLTVETDATMKSSNGVTYIVTKTADLIKIQDLIEIQTDSGDGLGHLITAVEQVADDEIVPRSSGLVINVTDAVVTIEKNGAVVEDANGTIPNDTGVYTVKKTVDGVTVNIAEVAVIKVKDAERGEKPSAVTTAVAVPFASLAGGYVTVDSLLNKALLNEGDEIIAWNRVYKRYDAWSMSKGSWGSSTTVTKDSDTASVSASSYNLFPGQAVWVRTAGKIVVYGTLPASDVAKVMVLDGVNLLGNRAMTDATPEAQVEVKTGDFVEIPGDTKGVRQYEKTGGGWKATWLPVPVMVGDKQLEINGAKVWETKTPTDDAPSVPAGRGYFLKRPPKAQSTPES